MWWLALYVLIILLYTELANFGRTIFRHRTLQFYYFKMFFGCDERFRLYCLDKNCIIVLNHMQGVRTPNAWLSANTGEIFSEWQRTLYSPEHSLAMDVPPTKVPLINCHIWEYAISNLHCCVFQRVRMYTHGTVYILFGFFLLYTLSFKIKKRYIALFARTHADVKIGS